MNLLFLAAAALYVTAAVAFLGSLFGRREGLVRLARVALAVALAVHLAYIGLQCTRGMNPLRDIRGALDLSGFLLGAGYLLASLGSRFGAIGGLVAPVSLALLIGSRITPAGTQPATATAGALGRVHIALSATGVAIFGIAAAVAMLYLFQESALKHKRIGSLYRRTPPLTALDEAGRRLILLGFPIFTLAVISGLIWVTRLPGEGFRLEHAISAVTWTIFAGLIAARVAVGLRGRSAALLTVFGFLSVLAVLLAYMGRRWMGG